MDKGLSWLSKNIRIFIASFMAILSLSVSANANSAATIAISDGLESIDGEYSITVQSGPITLAGKAWNVYRIYEREVGGSTEWRNIAVSDTFYWGVPDSEFNGEYAISIPLEGEAPRENGEYEYYAQVNRYCDVGPCAMNGLVQDRVETAIITVVVNKPKFPGKPVINSFPASDGIESEDGAYSVGWQAPTTGDFDYYLVQEKKGTGNWCYNQQSTDKGICYAKKVPVNSPRVYSVVGRDIDTYQYQVIACNALECGNSSDPVTVNVQPIPAPTVSWRTPLNGALLKAGTTQTLRIIASDENGLDISVKFYRNSIDSANLLNYPVDIDNQCNGCFYTNWPSVQVATTKLIAVVENEAGKTDTASISITVNSNTPPQVKFVPDNLPTEVVLGQMVTFIAEARDAEGDVSPVEFYVSGTFEGVGIETDDGSATGWKTFEFPWTVPAAGTYTVTARVTDEEGVLAESIQQVHFDALYAPARPTAITVDGQKAPFPVNTSGLYTLGWNEVAGATDGYVIEELQEGIGGETCSQQYDVNSDYCSFKVGSGVSSWLWPNQAHGKYKYRIRACNAAGCGEPSEVYSQTVELYEPQAPSGFSVSSVHSEFDFTGGLSFAWQKLDMEPLPNYYLLETKRGGVDSEQEWEQLTQVSQADAPEFLPEEFLPPGRYSYRLKACNNKGCGFAGEMITVDIQPPALISAEPACENQCLKVTGTGLDPDSSFTLSDIETGTQVSLTESMVILVPPTEEDATTYVQLALSAAMREVLFDTQKKGLRVSVENSNGELAGITAYGDETVERLSQINSAPAVGSDGTIYVGSGNKVYALSPEDGSVVSGWPYSTGDLVKATPTVDSISGDIYVGSLDDNLYALTPLGLEKWRLKTGGDLVSSAVLDESRILYQGSMDGLLYAVQSQNGAVQWTYSAGAGIAETPVLAGNGTLYFTTVASSQVYALGRGILGPDQLVWESSDQSLLKDSLEDNNWQPAEHQLPEYQTAGRLYRLLLQPPLNLSRDVLTFWTYALVNGASPKEVANAFLKSDTGKVNFSSLLSNEAFVDKLYERGFPGQTFPQLTFAGTAYSRDSLIAALTTGSSRAEIAVIVAQSTEFNALTNEDLRQSFDYFYIQNYEWAVFSCDEGNDYTRDCDGDGLPDHWEILFFGDIESESGDTDADGDGLSNRDAFLANLDPCANLCVNGATAIERDAAPMPTDYENKLGASGAVGTLPGNFRVNESGAATYQIPLSLPAGTSGVVPELSLSYSSQNGNGVLGHGWALGGLSAITRCRQTLGQDGKALPITWSSEDRFCLDGQRLLVVDGEYGAPGSLYRTEIDSFALVKAHQGSAGHPGYFTVERKDGSISYYGKAGNARQTTGKGTLSWAISTLEDSARNRIEFFYDSNGGQKIDEIRYAYSDLSGDRDSRSYGASVVFEYENRVDYISGYTAGEYLETSQRLFEIYVRNNDTEVRRYELEYLDYSADNLSRIERIRQCVGDLCQSDTVFDWRLPLPGSFAATPADIVTLSTQDDRASIGTRPADINGDGQMDLIWLEPDWYDDGSGEIAFQTFKYVLAEADGFGIERTVYQEGDNTYRPYEWQMVDYNADGRADLVTYLQDDKHWGVVLSTPDAAGNWFLQGVPRHLPDLTNRHAKFADINGDGLVDYVTSSEYRLLEPLGAPASNSNYGFGESKPVTFDIDWNQVTWKGPMGDEATPERAFIRNASAPADFNGDGLVDPFASLMMRAECLPGGSVTGTCEYSAGTAIVFSRALGDYQSNLYLGSVSSAEAVDINGDGLPDVVYRQGKTGYYRINTGTGFEEAVSLGEVPLNRQYFDYDNDGDTDIVWHDEEAHRLKVRRWRSLDGKFAQAESFRSTSGSENALHLFTDMNGDGVSDYVRVANDRAYLYRATDFRVPVNVIDKITNGIGAQTDIAYGALTNSGHYTRRDINTTTQNRCETASYGGMSDPNMGVTGAAWCQDYAVADLADYYSALNDDWSGKGGLGKLSPTLELMGAMYVVTGVASSAPTSIHVDTEGTGATSKISYYYAQAKVQAGGRGMLGFEELRTVDEQTGTETVTSYRQDFPFQGYPVSTKVITAEGLLLSESVNTWQLKQADGSAWTGWGGYDKEQGSAQLGPLKPWLETSVEKTWALESATGDEPLKTVTTTNEYDNFGNPELITVELVAANGDTFSTITDNVYDDAYSLSFANTDHNLSGYRELGRLTRVSVIHNRSENGEFSDETRTSAFTYYQSGAQSGLLKTETIEPDAEGEDANLKLATSYEYDAYGNKVRVTQQAADVVETRSGSWEYLDNQGRYLLRETNAYNQIVSEVAARNALGLPITVKDALGKESQIRYDAFGRKVLEYSPTGAYTVSLLDAPSGYCPAGSAYQQSVTTAGGGESLTCFDTLARAVRSATVGFDGNWVYADTEYDKLGRVHRKSEPYKASLGTAQFWTVMSYDILGRVVGTDLPGTVSNNGTGYDVHMAYSGYSTVTTNPEGYTKTEVKNAKGELTLVTDHLQGEIRYRYDAQGNLRFVNRTATDNAQTPQTEMRYDRLGRKIWMQDPDKGGWQDKYWQYAYNGFGELVWQIDAKGQQVRNTYDKLGRLTRRIDYRADGSTEGDTEWSFNNGTEWLRMDVGIQIPPGALESVIDFASGYIRNHDYDDLGRPTRTGYNFSLDVDSDVHGERTTYDEYGRTLQQFDAAGDGFSRSAIQNIYNDFGYLEAVVDGENINQASAESFYTVLAMDERGNVTESRQGNGVVTTRQYDPATGRLQYQSASLLGINRIQDLTYQWDNLGNLEYRHDKSGDKDLFEDFGYDALNRLKSAQVTGRDAQTLKYDGFGNIKHKSDVGTYYYAGADECAESAGPHALCATSDGVTYSYDANGNMTSDSSDSSSRSLKYSTFDKPLEIKKGGHTTLFTYDVNRSRYLRVDIDSTGNRTETRYIGNVEKISRSDGSKEIKRYLPGGAVVTIASGERKTNYLHKDHLGSVDVITDASGSVIQEMSFDAWGQRRHAQSWDALISSALTSFDSSITTRGYTGHEMLDQVGLIHMNGRIYDAKLGRFMQADLQVQFPSDTQSYNRYSYTHNNPLTYTDSSGFGLDIFDAIKIIGSVVLAIIPGGQAFIPAWNAFWSGAQTAYYGGDFGQIATAAFSSYVMAAAGADLAGGGFSPGDMFTFGVMGGIAGVLNGGKFGHGFVSASIGAAVGGGLKLESGAGWANVSKGIARIAIAGSVSKATGGKFANGAATAAFVVALEAGSLKPDSGNQKRNKIYKSEQSTQQGILDADFDASGSDPIYRNFAKGLSNPDDEYTVVAHGDKHTMQFAGDGRDAKYWAGLIGADIPEGVSVVRLYSCNVGALDNGFAQQLVNELAVYGVEKVIAPDNYIGFQVERVNVRNMLKVVPNSATYTIGNITGATTTDGTGSWRVFTRE
ncbi:FG-GAP-like repeat-containing protein [Microbulbifer sp. CAU 1566]|uniref:FG-GAP-like repeat-containing protein n=1 Tax=Microbulbifer sp. CAU 1566 TaxID=2933269 RepID=UPI00200403ED|nr:FG-GAP-like repeat-containing protein [Microbulbifer sp. CAU 1566]MCK7598028.1 FG-GAP-like repeat-containing protein [Microbulbifer sp. CAU 1566]